MIKASQKQEHWVKKVILCSLSLQSDLEVKQLGQSIKKLIEQQKVITSEFWKSVSLF